MQTCNYFQLMCTITQTRLIQTIILFFQLLLQPAAVEVLTVLLEVMVEAAAVCGQAVRELGQ